MEEEAEDKLSTVNYYSLIKKYLKKQYKNISDNDLKLLCKEVIFAPDTYKIQIQDLPEKIIDVRKNLAAYIEREASTKNFIPYSINAKIAELIEQTRAETASMNEYYRWVNVAADIVKHTGDGLVTRDDAAERRAFISMSYNRETELLLCLALYQGAGPQTYQDQIDLLAFKLDRLRELRHIVFNTSRTIASQKRGGKDQLRQYYDYCQLLLKQNLRDISKFRLKLKINRYDNMDDEDYENDIFYLDYLRKIVLYMIRKRRRRFLQSQLEEARANELTPAEVVLMSQARNTNVK